MIDTVERARGRWREILPQLGVDIRFLSNKHGPCPLCGGRDRYRFDDREGTGSYYCNQCGAGVGLILLRKLHGWNHAKACCEVDKIIGSGLADSKVVTNRKPDDFPRRRSDIEHLLDEARTPQIVTDYLMGRGIGARSSALRGHPRCPYFDDDHKLVGYFPAVIAPIVGAAGELQSAQRIYIGDLNHRKKPLPPVSSIKRASIRLFDLENGVLGIAEGVETALAAHVLFKVPVWSVLSANGVEGFDPSSEVRHLHVFADNDRNFVGQAAAYQLAKRLSRDRPEITVRVHIPTVEGADFNDVLKNTPVMTERFVMLGYAVFDSPAYRALRPIERDILWLLIRHHNGRNNGDIALGVRESSEHCHCSHMTACRALANLQKSGFISATRKGHLVPQIGRPNVATRWRLHFVKESIGNPRSNQGETNER